MRLAIIGATILSWVAIIPAFADDPPPFPEFTFKREKPPEAGTKRFITIQIEPAPEPSPEEKAAAAAKPEKAEPEQNDKDIAAADIGQFGWFWRNVSTDISTDSYLRLRDAFRILTVAPEEAPVFAPRLQALQRIAEEEGRHILRATVGTSVSPALVLAVISVESGGRPQAVSPKGAQGLMQLMPATAKRFGVADSHSEYQNIRGGVAYLDWLLREFNGDAVLALAGYNAGENAVKRHDGVPPYAETRDYVPKVLAAYQVARGLCRTQPEFITDACSFTVALN